MVKWINVFACADEGTSYWTVEELLELKQFFCSKVAVWQSGLETPNLAEKAAYAVFRNAMKKVSVETLRLE